MRERLQRFFPLLFFIWTAGLCWYWNHDLGEYGTWEKLRAMNDVPFVLRGYEAVPNPLTGGWVWWHGPWIEQTVQVFRPIASYLFWLECWLGTHGYISGIFAVGFLIYLAVALLCGALAWRLTRSYLCVLLAGYLATQVRTWNYGGGHPKYWLIWFPVHHDLLFIGFLLAGLCCFDSWLENNQNRYLYGAWACFVLGVLTKEYGYIFPILAGILTLTRKQVPEAALDRRESKAESLFGLILRGFGGHGLEEGARPAQAKPAFPINRPQGLRQVFFTFAFVLAMAAYRSLVLPHPYNPPHLKIWHMLRRPFLYWFYPFYRTVLTEEYWIPGLAVVTTVAILGAIYWSRTASGRNLRAKPFGFMLPVIVPLVVVSVYLQLAKGSIPDAFWYFSEPKNADTRIAEFGGMLFLLYALFLVWKYRRDEAGIAALLLLMLIYGPVWTYLGWHYTLAGWFIRCGVWWPVVAKLVWRDVKSFLPARTAKISDPVPA